MTQGRNNMQMIDVLKRLAELDATNPNVVPAKTTIKESAIEECGPMGMMAPEPKTPATINITAGDGEELGNMLAAIMQLAGVHKVEPEHLGAEPEPATVTAEPSLNATPTAGDDMRAVLDKLHPETDSEEDDEEEETDESAVNRSFDNSPEEEDEGYDAFTDHGDMAKNPAGAGAGRRTTQPNANPTTFESLMDEYKKFIAEDTEMGDGELDIDSFTNGNRPNFTGRDEEDFDKAQEMFVNFLKKKGKAVDSINDDAFPVLIAMCQGRPCAWYDLENAHGYLAP